MVAMMLMLSTLTASAGKLHDGFMGMEYGPVEVLKEAPHADCQANTEPSVAWDCNVVIGEAATKVAYMADDGLYFGLVVNTESYSDGSALLSVLKAAYGKGRASNTYDTLALADWEWTDKDTHASWTYNEFSHKGQYMVLRMDLYAKIKAKADKKAAAAAGGL